MARRRMIDPSIWSDPDFAKLSPQARLLFIACFSNADDDGRLIANPAILRSYAFVYDNVTDRKVVQLLFEVVQHLKSVHYYECGGVGYLHFAKWETYQHLRGDRRVASTLPQCGICADTMTDKVSTKPRTNDGVVKYRLDKNSVGKGESEREGEGSAPLAQRDFSLDAIRARYSFLQKNGGSHE